MSKGDPTKPVTDDVRGVHDRAKADERTRANLTVGDAMDGNYDISVGSGAVATADGFARVAAAGGRNGKREKERRFTRLMKQAMDDMARLQDLNNQIDALRAERGAIEAKYLDEDTRQQRPGESYQDYINRLDKELQQKVANGEMSEEEYQKWRKIVAEEGKLVNEANQVAARLREKQIRVQAELDEIQIRLIALQQLDMKLAEISKLTTAKERDEAVQKLAEEQPELKKYLDKNGDGEVKFSESEEKVREEQVELTTTADNAKNVLDEIASVDRTSVYKLEDSSNLDNAESGKRLSSSADSMFAEEEDVSPKTTPETATLAPGMN